MSGDPPPKAAVERAWRDTARARLDGDPAVPSASKPRDAPRAPLDDTPSDATLARTRRGAALALLAGGAVLLAAGVTALAAGGLSPLAFGLAALGWLALGALVLGGLRHHPHDRFGAANAVTTARAAITVALGALLVETGALAAGAPVAGAAALSFDTALATAGAWWAVTALAVLALALDGVDGPFARRQGLASAFGARYDMETDAALALVLALLVWRGGELGIWILLLGTLRYAFVAAARVVPALRAPLFPSLRRKTVCVVQVAALCAIVSPAVAPPYSIAIGVVATLALVGSFGRDVAWLLRTAPQAPAKTAEGDVRTSASSGATSDEAPARTPADRTATPVA